MLEKRREAPMIDNWLEGYNLSTEAEEKRGYLEQGLAEERSPENLLRQKLWEKRYLDKGGRATGADQFMAQWMELSFQKDQLNSFFGRKRAEKKIRKIYENLMFSEGTTEELRHVLYLEYMNLVSLYIMLCQKDKNYKSVILGIGNMKEENLMAKIARDVYGTACAVPKMCGMEEEFELLSRAAKDSFLTAFPRESYVWTGTAEDTDRELGL